MQICANFVHSPVGTDV